MSDILDKPIQEGVDHGPYEPKHNWSQFEGHEDAIDDAHDKGRISDDSYIALLSGLMALARIASDADDDDHDAEMARLDKLNDDGRDEEEDNEDPLDGDVDRWVHPDETRSDEQIARDEKYASNLDDDDDYWDEYDELHSDDELEPTVGEEDDITTVAAEKAKGILADVSDDIPHASDSGHNEDV